MKDLDMTDINPDELQLSGQQFEKFKSKLERALRVCDELADVSDAYGVKLCRMGDAENEAADSLKWDYYDQRDNYYAMAGHFRAAGAALSQGRALGGKIQGGGLTRSGGT